MIETNWDRIILFLFGAYHFIVGVPSVLSFAWLRRVGAFFYRLKIPVHPDPQFEYVLKPLGVYALFVSILSFYVCLFEDPLSRKNYLLVCAFLLSSRGLCRLFYSALFLKAFGTTAIRNRANAYFTFIVATVFIGAYIWAF